MRSVASTRTLQDCRPNAHAMWLRVHTLYAQCIGVGFYSGRLFSKWIIRLPWARLISLCFFLYIIRHFSPPPKKKKFTFKLFPSRFCVIHFDISRHYLWLTLHFNILSLDFFDASSEASTHGKKALHRNADLMYMYVFMYEIMTKFGAVTAILLEELQIQWPLWILLQNWFVF